MAAHILTALNEIKAWDWNNQDWKIQSACWGQLRSGRDNAIWGSLLSVNEFIGLGEIIDRRQIITLQWYLDVLIKKYRVLWYLLDEPATYEEWVIRLAKMKHYLGEEDFNWLMDRIDTKA